MAHSAIIYLKATRTFRASQSRDRKPEVADGFESLASPLQVAPSELESSTLPRGSTSDIRDAQHS